MVKTGLGKYFRVNIFVVKILIICLKTSTYSAGYGVKFVRSKTLSILFELLSITHLQKRQTQIRGLAKNTY